MTGGRDDKDSSETGEQGFDHTVWLCGTEGLSGEDHPKQSIFLILPAQRRYFPIPENGDTAAGQAEVDFLTDLKNRTRDDA